MLQRQKLVHEGGATVNVKFDNAPRGMQAKVGDMTGIVKGSSVEIGRQMSAA